MELTEKDIQGVIEFTNKKLRETLYKQEIEKENLELTAENITLIKPKIDEIVKEYEANGTLKNLMGAAALVCEWNYNVKFENLLNHILNKKPINKKTLWAMHEPEEETTQTINLKFSEDEWTMLLAGRACDKYHREEKSIEKYCKDVLLQRAESILEPSSEETKMICPHCNEITEFRMCCEKCNKIFYEAKITEIKGNLV